MSPLQTPQMNKFTWCFLPIHPVAAVIQTVITPCEIITVSPLQWTCLYPVSHFQSDVDLSSWKCESKCSVSCVFVSCWALRKVESELLVFATSAVTMIPLAKTSKGCPFPLWRASNTPLTFWIYMGSEIAFQLTPSASFALHTDCQSILLILQMTANGNQNTSDTKIFNQYI